MLGGISAQRTGWSTADAAQQTRARWGEATPSGECVDVCVRVGVTLRHCETGSQNVLRSESTCSHCQQSVCVCVCVCVCVFAHKNSWGKTLLPPT